MTHIKEIINNRVPSWLHHIWNPSLIVYLVIFLVLWDTRGMSNENQRDFPVATSLLTASFLISAFAVFFRTIRPVHENSLYFILLAQFVFLGFSNFSPHHYLFNYTVRTSYIPVYHLLWGLCFMLAVSSFFWKSQRITFLRILLLFAGLLSIIVVVCSTESGIDTHLFLNMASDYLFELKNPYTYTYPDIYNGRYSALYGNTYYFNYWPTPLYICSVFRALFSDVRYAFVFAQLVFVYFMIKHRNNLGISQVLLMATVWLLNMVVLFVNERSWLDALAVPLLLVSLLLLQQKNFLAAGILAGLLASLKVYYVFALPFYGIYLLREKKFKEIVIMGAAFTATFVPFVIADFSAFYQSTISFINGTKIRPDSLSVVSALKRIYDIDASQIGFIVMFACMGVFYLLFWCGKNNILQMLKYINLTFFVIFLSSKQSFCNYFYFNMLCAFTISYLESNFHYEQETKH